MDRIEIFLKKLSCVLCIIIILISLSACPIPETEVIEPLIASWTSYGEAGGAITLSWISRGGKTGHSYLLQRLIAESDWLPEDGVLYSSGDAAVPGLQYSGSEQSFIDSSVIAGEVYYYRLFAADGGLSYSEPITITITLSADGVSVIEAPLLLYIRQETYYVDIGWEESGANTAGYIIAKAESPISWNPDNGSTYSSGQSVTGASILHTGTGSTYSDTEVEGGREYYYKIFAFNSEKLYSTGLQSRLLFEAESDLAYDRFPWINNYIIYYGPLDNEAINTAKKYDLAIIHSNNSAITRDQVRQIQRGFNADDPTDDVLVIAYVAVGEDLRTTGFYPDGAAEPDYEAMLDDDRFVRNGIGPRVDPRGPKPMGDVLEWDYSVGNESPGGTGFASYYLDDNDAVNHSQDSNHDIDGKPDFNESWRGAFVNAGDPLWFQEVDQMRHSTDGIFGLQELLTTSVGEGLGVDGIFMDALDTCAPNGWTNKDSFVQTEFEWTAPGYADFIMRLKDKYPDKIVVQNRAVYFFRPGFVQQYLKYTTRPYIDFLLFESFRLNSSSTEDFNEAYYRDNLYNYAPPVLAEAGREDGFQVLSLGYAEGPSITLSSALDAGVNNSSLIDDLRVTQNIGFRHYLSNRSVDHINTYVLDRTDLTDTTSPAWSSIYNAQSAAPPEVSGPPNPRWGLLKAESPSSGVIRIYWDLAQDKHPVDYYLYYDSSPLDFANNPQLEGIHRIKLTPQMPEEYRTHSVAMTDEVYPFYDDVEGFTPGESVHLCVRAVDRSPGRNMDTNTSTLFITP
ncbi:MAG: hypothetical protein JEZ04_05195 [Spirochaetales bacterium]|nr:hypothetical protein [Spirochaetales bacterium]